MEGNNISVENIREEIKKLKLEITEKESQLEELSNMVNGVNEEVIED